MKVLGIGIAAFLLAGSAALAGQAVLIGSASLRAGPDPLYEVVTSATAGTRVETVEGTVGWTLVRLSNGAAGWVPNGQLAAPGAVPPSATATANDNMPTATEGTEVARYTSVVWPTAGRLNLRAGPGTGYGVLASMERGDWVAVTAEAGAWVKVEHESGATGWAYRSYLTR